LRLGFLSPRLLTLTAIVSGAVFVAASVLALSSGTSGQSPVHGRSGLVSAQADASGSPGNLLIGGASGLGKRLGALHGRPIILNAWASWCPPCRDELPLLGDASRTYGRRVAFLGADVDDDAAQARDLLADSGVPYPSYRTTRSELTRLAPVAGVPATVFIGRGGRLLYVHAGQYTDEAALSADIARYALHRASGPLSAAD
jgi:thiol-disulfide isomerase/thioredoxin